MKKNESKKEREQLKSELRSHLCKMADASRILLKDGQIGFFRGFEGTQFTGDTFTFVSEKDGAVLEVPLEQYDCILIQESAFSCPVCQGKRIMKGVLRNADGGYAAFREDITFNPVIMPSFNSRRIHLRACRDCGYVMPFVNVNPEARKEEVQK